MTTSEINERIAILCGWEKYHSKHRNETRWRAPDGTTWAACKNYAGDDEAFSEVVRKLGTKAICEALLK